MVYKSGNAHVQTTFLESAQSVRAAITRHMDTILAGYPDTYCMQSYLHAGLDSLPVSCQVHVCKSLQIEYTLGYWKFSEY
jgi:hypothetical protein